MNTSFADLATPSAIELEDLLHDYLLGLVLIGAGGTGPHAVQWVHVSDIADPSPFLTPRTVLLTTGSQFSTPLERDEADTYVHRLQQAGTTALGVGVGLQWDRIPHSLIEACAQAKLSLFRVPYDTPFIAVVRTAARLIEAKAHADATWGREQFSALSSLGRRRNLTEAEQQLRSAVLTLMLAGQAELAVRVAAPLLPRLPRGQVCVLAVPEPVSPKARGELAPLLESQPGVFSSAQPRQTVIIAEHGELAGLRRILTKHATTCGISERGSSTDAAELLAQAERAAELALLDAAPGPLAYRPEMHAGVLQLLKQSPEATRRAQGLLAPLAQHDRRHSDDLQRSLTVWLSRHGQMSAAATELGVHRHTLRTRVSTAASLLQRDLDDPDTRAELWAALRITGPANHGPANQTPGETAP